MKKTKFHIVFLDKEKQKINKLLQRKKISARARLQLKLILMLGEGGRVVEAAEIFAISNQTIAKWKKSFNKDRLKSLLVYSEKKNDDGDDSKGEGKKEKDSSDGDNTEKKNE